MAGNGDIRDSAVNDVVAVDRNGLVDHDGKCLKLKLFSGRNILLKAVSRSRQGDMCEADKIGKKGVERARNVMSVCIIFQRACRTMTTSVIWGFYPIALFSAFSRWRQVSII